MLFGNAKSTDLAIAMRKARNAMDRRPDKRRVIYVRIENREEAYQYAQERQGVTYRHNGAGMRDFLLA